MLNRLRQFSVSFMILLSLTIFYFHLVLPDMRMMVKKLDGIRGMKVVDISLIK